MAGLQTRFFIGDSRSEAQPFLGSSTNEKLPDAANQDQKASIGIIGFWDPGCLLGSLFRAYNLFFSLF